ncbi:unnamed protein product [Oikopleura dioica]|uniref:Uncharacterized protein n=1 Tax=Oikopleura dioica TaxID=34765 RepID=E4Y5A6_OIKDI|nr:unnamed protein product [Oikopleura dioica]
MLFVFIISSTFALSSINALKKSNCTWADAENRVSWKETGRVNHCQTCRCIDIQDSIYLDCQSALRPTAWPAECIPKQKGCRTILVERKNPRKRCPVLAFTSYRHLLWVADRPKTTPDYTYYEQQQFEGSATEVVF